MIYLISHLCSFSDICLSVHIALHELISEICTLGMQVAHSPYSGFMHCLRHTVQKRGVKALFKSYPTTVSRLQLLSLPAQNSGQSSLCLSSAMLSGCRRCCPSLSTNIAPCRPLCIKYVSSSVLILS